MAAHELETAAVEESLDEVHDLLDRAWVADASVPDRDRMAFVTAVAEVAANIVEHASRGEPVRLRLVLHVLEDRLEAHFEDRGRPYEPPPTPEHEDELAETGRGLAMVRALVDEVEYERDGPVNRWVVVRSRSG